MSTYSNYVVYPEVRIQIVVSLFFVQERTIHGDLGFFVFLIPSLDFGLVHLMLSGDSHSSSDNIWFDINL